jgi:hypothetical protein
MFIKNGDSHPITIVEPKSNDRILLDDKITKKKLGKVLKEVAEKEKEKLIPVKEEINE